MKILNAGPGFSQPMTEDELYHFLLLEEEISTLQVQMKRMNQIFILSGIILTHRIKNSTLKPLNIQRKKRIQKIIK